MPLYQYEGFKSDGAKVQGIVEATSPKDARSQLREQGYMVSGFNPVVTGSLQGKLSGAALSTFTMQLSQMLSAGLPLYDALLTLEEQYRGEAFHPLILSICERIKGGASLSEAMREHPSSFDSLYCAMLEAGESSGSLDTMLSRLSTYLNKQNTLRGQIVTAMIYPAVLAGFTFLVVLLLLMFVVPSIEEVFGEGKLNGYTAAVLSVSHFLTDYWWVYLPISISGALLAIAKLKTAEGKQWLDALFLRLPIVQGIVIQASMARFARTMATLQEGGVTVIDSLRMSRAVVSNHIIAGIFQRAEERIIEGSNLSVELKNSPIIPHLVSRMLAVGEETGDLSTVLTHVAEIYEEDVEKSLSRLTALAQPVILVVLGGVVGMVLLAVLLPFTDISSLSLN